MSGMLYLVATPIGNLGDLSPRAVETLERCDFIAAEDTRVTLKLLNHFHIKRPLVPYHAHNCAAAGGQILARLLAGETCALVTDAGTPAVSDPGEALVALCAGAGVEVRGVPGCCAAVMALSLSGLPTGRFAFEGFLPAQAAARRRRLAALAGEERTLIFYEAPHRLSAALEDMAETLGAHRPAALCREMTKLHEEVVRGTLAQVLAQIRETAVRGEMVIVVSGAPAGTLAVSYEDALAQVRSLRAEGVPLKEAARRAAQATGHSKNALYAAALKE